MKKFVVAGVAMAAMLLSLSGCYWPGHWQHHDRDGGRYERYDSRGGYDYYRGGYDHQRRGDYYHQYDPYYRR